MPAKLSPDRSRGLIIACGDLVDDARCLDLLSRIIAALGPPPRVVLVSIPETTDEAAELENVLVAAGAAEVHHYRLGKREDAEARALLDATEQAQLVLLGASTPLRLSRMIGGTSLARTIRRGNASGAAVLGFGAGAALLSEHMLAAGSEGATPRSGGATLAPGLGLTNRVVIDQGGHSSDRLGRLLAALALNPFALGLGLDVATAAVIGADNVLEVMGHGGVTLIDPSEMGDSNAADVGAADAPIRITNLRLHALTGGARYDLDFRRSID